MSGDYSRDTFEALRDIAGVFLQQGRAILDSDWNEMVRVFERRIRAQCVDTIGRAVVPRETIDGFRIRLPDDGSLEIGRGRKYLDGMLLECHGRADFTGIPALPGSPIAPVFDRGRPADDGPGDGPEGVLDELISPPTGDFLPYSEQPYWPTPAPLPTPNTAGTADDAHLAYVVAWQREVTPVEAPELLEPALGGIDTSTRIQTVWQVRLLENVGANANCASLDDDLDGWGDEIAPSTARLTTDTVDIEDPENPCLVPPTDGYTGTENQSYRIELHVVGDGQGAARFKFSRENASVVAAIESIGSPANRVTVSRIGRDDVLAFRPGDWVEVTDDHREFNHRSGRMLRVAVVHHETREIEFEQSIDQLLEDADLIPTGSDGDTLSARRSRLIRWDQRGEIVSTDGTLLTDLDLNLSDGLIPVPDDDAAVVLEAGITVSFSTAEGPGGFRELDYWRFAARTVGTRIEKLRAAPPDGIQRHYCRLAIVRLPSSVLDCRVFWPPEFEGGGDLVKQCGCTVCVTEEAHNSGALTLQAAIDQLAVGGGTVCLGTGTYLLRKPVQISNRSSIKVTGQGSGTVLVYRAGGAAIRLSSVADIQFERFSLFVLPATLEDVSSLPAIHGISAINTTLTAFRRLAIVVLAVSPRKRSDCGIALDGVQLGVKIEECVALAPIALGSRSSRKRAQGAPNPPEFVAFGELRVVDNILFGGRDAVHFDRVAFNIADAIFTRNLIAGTATGMRINWVDLPTGVTLIQDSTIQSDGTALILGATDVHLTDCEISAGSRQGDGVRLVPNIAPDIATDARIIGNSIFDLSGAGIRIAGNHGALLIKQNIVRRCGEAGIATTADAVVRDIAIDNNVIEEIADTTGQPAAGGIMLAGIEAGRISANSLRSIGRGGVEGQLYVGIGVQGVGSITISENVLVGIGPNLTEARAFSILARPPYSDLRVSDNQISGSNNGTNRVNWAAIAIGLPPTIIGNDGIGEASSGFAAALPGLSAEELGFVVVNDEVFRISATHLAAVAVARFGQISVSGNQIRAAIHLTGPLVTVFDAGALVLNFSQNQGTLASEGGAREVVLLGAQRMTVSANSVLHQTSIPVSMRLLTGKERAATAVGNITSTKITLNGSGIPAPFDALNLNS